jgi:CubicO group peptidase (beta-lactamase class C family)
VFRLVALIAIAAFSAAAFGSVDELVARIEELQREHHVPAVGLVVIAPPDASFVAAWGRSGDAAAPTVDATTPFRLGSITKTFTALALAAALEQRAIGFDTPLDAVVGDGFFDNPFAARPVRLRHLVEHTAGFGDLSRIEFDYADPKPLALAEALALDPSSRRVLWAPGTRHSYSNVSPGLSALAIERLTGEAFEAFTERMVLKPLGMPNAAFFPLLRLARGFRDDGVTEIPYWNMTFRAYGALNASTSEMASFLDVLLHDGMRDGVHVIAATTMATLRVPQSTLAAAVGLRIGYGLGMYGWVNRGYVFWGHGGDADGFRSRYALLPEAGRAYFVVINSDDPATLGRMQAAIETYLTADLPASAEPARAKLAAAELARWAGEYYPSSARFAIEDWRARRSATVQIDVAEEGLVFRSPRRTLRLLPTEPQLFRRADDPVATLAFITVPLDGAPALVCTHLQGELGNYVRLDPQLTQDLQNRCIRE